MSVAAVMMVTYNRLEMTKQTMTCLLNQTVPFHLIIVDNKSEKDETVNYLKKIYQDYLNGLIFNNLESFQIIFNDENKGIAIGRNQALKAASQLDCDYYTCIDNDVIIKPTCIQDTIEAIQKTKYGIIGTNFENQQYPIKEINGCKIQDKPQGNAGTAMMTFSKAVFKMIGYFSTEYNKYGLEDSDYGMRTRVVGFKIGYLPEPGIHIGGNESPEDEYRKWKTQQHDSLIHKFQENCRLYWTKQKSVYFPYKDTKGQ